MELTLEWDLAKCYSIAAGLGGFWQTLHTSQTVQSVVPHTRWSIDDCYDPEGSMGKLTVRFAAFIAVSIVSCSLTNQVSLACTLWGTHDDCARSGLHLLRLMSKLDCALGLCTTLMHLR